MRWTVATPTVTAEAHKTVHKVWVETMLWPCKHVAMVVVCSVIVMCRRARVCVGTLEAALALLSSLK